MSRCDHAIGVADGALEPIQAAKESIVPFWRSQFDGWDQARWVNVLDEGLIDGDEANAWRDEVWSQE